MRRPKGKLRGKLRISYPKHCGRKMSRRKNYAFGRKSKARISYSCKNCGKIE